MLPPLTGGGIKRWCGLASVWRLSDVCLMMCVWRLSVAYIGHHFQGQKVKVTRPNYSPPCWRVRQLQRWAWVRVGREKLLRCRLLGRAKSFGAHGDERGGGISWRSPAYSLFKIRFHVRISEA